MARLARRINPREMGSRVQRAVPKDLDKKKKAADKQDSSERAAERRQEASSFPLLLLGFPPTGFLA
jgi:pre-mRNA-splicing helicase BRR2